MDMEIKMQKLLCEENYLGNLIEQLSELKYRKGYDTITNDILKLIDDLQDKKATIKNEINDITDEVVTAAETWAADAWNTNNPSEFCDLDY